MNRPRLHRGVYDAAESNLGNRPIAGENREFTGTIRPDGTGSIGIRRRKGELKTERIDHRDRKSKLRAVEYLDWDLYPGEENTTRVVRCEVPPRYLPPLSLSEVSIGRTPSQRISKGLTLRGKRTISSGTKLLEKRYGVSNLGFYTLTCPFSDPSEVEKFNDAFPLIVKRTLECIRRHYIRLGLKFSYIGCHEIQSSRAERTGICALHFHWVSNCRVPGTRKFVLSSSEIRDIYDECVYNATGVRYRGTTRIGAEICRKSSGSYLAKYMSKGSPSDDSSGGHLSSPRLSSWYACARNLLHLIRATTYTPSGADIDDVLLSASGASRAGDIIYARSVKRLVCGENRVVGYVFSVSAQRMHDWLDFCKPVILQYL